jgi:hypothetical protein
LRENGLTRRREGAKKEIGSRTGSAAIQQAVKIRPEGAEPSRLPLRVLASSREIVSPAKSRRKKPHSISPFREPIQELRRLRSRENELTRSREGAKKEIGSRTGSAAIQQVVKNSRVRRGTFAASSSRLRVFA